MGSILVFDSGFGGLSVLEAVKELLPEKRYIYTFDNEAFPYGELSDDTLIDRVNRIILALCETHSISIVIIACNTASTLVLPSLRAKLDIPIVGVVPAIKPAAGLSVKKAIGLLATPATVNREYTLALVNEFANDCEVVLVGSTDLVKIAEEKIQGKIVDKEKLERIMQPFKDKVDCIVLGCTHFPLLREEINEVLGKGYKVIDSGEAIANRTMQLLSERKKKGDIENTASLNEPNIAYYSAKNSDVEKLNKELAPFGFTEIRRVPFF
nr:glutamate racemase [Veronia nyctiphanis]